MILTKCYISSFGKLKDVTFDFSSGLNVFKEENGWGKSTLANFIKCIFYGLKDGKRSVSENERTKFKPWNSTERFGGYVEFVWANQSFRLERFFGNKSSEDTVQLIDLNTGKLFPNTDNLGERIFKIDEEGFLSTTYFSEKDFQVKSNTSITAKFNSVCEISDNHAFDDALSKLEKKSKTYKMTGDKGLIAQTKRDIFNVDEEIQKARLASNTAKNLSLSASQLENEVVSLKEQVSKLTAKVTDATNVKANAVKKTQYENFLSKKNQLLQRKADFERVLNNKTLNESEFNEYVNRNNELNRIVERAKVLEQTTKALKPENAVQPKEKSTKTPLILSVFGVLPLLLAIIMAIVTGEVFSPTTIISAVVFILLEVGALITHLLKGQKSDSANSQIDTVYQNNLIELNEYKQIITANANAIDAYLSGFSLGVVTNRTSAFEMIAKVKNELVAICQSLAEIEKDIVDLGNPQEFLTQNLEVSDLNLLEIQLNSLQNEYTIKARELANKRSDIKYFTDKADVLSDLEEKKAELTADLNRYKEEFEIVKLTIEYFEKADENLKTKYRAPLQNSLNKYLALIDGNKKNARIDIDLNVTVEEQGQGKVTDYYSKGYQNLFEICKRFALTDVLFNEEKPFIILDDPFYNLDDAKIENAIKLIRNLAEEYQILYFVCHESRRA